MALSWKQTLGIAKEVLGLDIGSSQVKLIELDKASGGYTVTAAAVSEVSYGDDGEMPDDNARLEALRECIDSASPKTRMAVCSVSGPEVAVRSFSFPSLPGEEMASAVQLEAAQVCPFNVDDGEVDYQMMDDKGDSGCGVLVAATNELIHTKKKLASQATLNCALVDVDGLALLNCFNELENDHGSKKKSARRTTAILNVGSRYTTLAIMGSNGLPFVRDVAYAGGRIIEQIATEINLTQKVVRQALSGGSDTCESVPDLTESFARACRKLITDVEETLRYYTAQEKIALVEKIFVCGGFALTNGFVNLLDTNLPAKVVLWNPFDKIRCGAGRSSESLLSNSGPALAVAAGLAMRSI
jgi:type IV pilus assembly protein PilM